jgi:hypothetical protein
MKNSQPRTVAIKINQGMALKHLAGLYPTLRHVILELVQNALDVDVVATRIWIKINLKTRFISVRDNGSGASIPQFEAALASVAEPERKGRGSIGQFGIGLISPLGKCERFTFTSCPHPHKYGFVQWVLETDRLFAQRETISMPLPQGSDRLTMDQSADPKRRDIVEWRTEVSLYDITQDKLIGEVDPEALIGAILDRFGAVMRKNKVRLTVSFTSKKGEHRDWLDVTASEFRGRKLPEVEIINPEAGKTLFRLFIARASKGGRDGKVLMGTTRDDSRFPFHYLARSTDKLLAEEVVTALASGVFEGEIISEKARMHASRQTFEKDDVFIDLCCAIDEWYHQHGAAYLEEAKEGRKEERRQRLGLQSLRVIEGIMKVPGNAYMLDVIRGFGRGTVGAGHAELPKRQTGKEQDHPSLSLDGKPGVPRTKTEGEEKRERSEPTKEQKEHIPLTSAGPKGERRRVVSRSSFGLQFAHEPMAGVKELWQLDVTEGVLTFNIRHPSWEICEAKNDTAVMRLQEHVAMSALTLYAMPQEVRLVQREVLDKLTDSVVTWILTGDKLRGTIPSRPKKTAEK